MSLRHLRMEAWMLWFAARHLRLWCVFIGGPMDGERLRVSTPGFDYPGPERYHLAGYQLIRPMGLPTIARVFALSPTDREVS